MPHPWPKAPSAHAAPRACAGVRTSVGWARLLLGGPAASRHGGPWPGRRTVQCSLLEGSGGSRLGGRPYRCLGSAPPGPGDHRQCAESRR